MTIRSAVVADSKQEVWRKAMKIAITSVGDTLQSDVDPRFGRAKYIIIVDSETKEFEAIDNTDNINAFKGAGIQAATMISEKGAEVLLTGYCGPNAFKTLKAAGIKIVDNVSGVVEENISLFKEGKLQYSEEPNTQGHW